MRTLIRVRGFEAPTALHDYVLHRLNFSLKPYEDYIEQITVHLGNAGDSDARAHRSCAIVAILRGGTTIAVEESGLHISAAVDVAVKRILYNIAKSRASEREAIGSALLH
jgi:ribosome-associated translation inhibitor RaiA